MTKGPEEPRLFKLFVLWKTGPKHVSVSRHKIAISQTLGFQFRDLMGAISELYPTLSRSEYRLYGRYGDCLHYIKDHISMMAALKLMTGHASSLLYMVRKPLDVERGEEAPDVKTSDSCVIDVANETGDLQLILENCRGDGDDKKDRSPLYRPEHMPPTVKTVNTSSRAGSLASVRKMSGHRSKK